MGPFNMVKWCKNDWKKELRAKLRFYWAVIVETTFWCWMGEKHVKNTCTLGNVLYIGRTSTNRHTPKLKHTHTSRNDRRRWLVDKTIGPNEPIDTSLFHISQRRTAMSNMAKCVDLNVHACKVEFIYTFLVSFWSLINGNPLYRMIIMVRSGSPNDQAMFQTENQNQTIIIIK